MNKKKLRAELQEKQNRPLLTTVLWTVVLAVVVSCLIAKESAEKGTISDVVNYLSFALLFTSGGLILMWFRLNRLERRTQIVTELMDDLEKELWEEEEADEEEEEEEEEEEDDDDDQAEEDDEEDDDDKESTQKKG